MNKIKIYIEPSVFPYCFGENETSKFPKYLLEKAKEGKIELKTSALSSLQYIGAVNESFVKRKIDKQTCLDYIDRFCKLEEDMKDNLTYVYPTYGIREISISHVLKKYAYYEDALHIATAQVSKCDMYVMADQYRDINKKDWKNDFEIVGVTNKTEVDSALDKINKL